MDALRIDRWLHCARLAKTRSRAAAMCAEGLVAVNGAVIVRASHVVRRGDVVVVAVGRRRWRAVRVVDLVERRGPFSQASLAYEEVAPPPEVISLLEHGGDSCDGNPPP